ncbi:ATP-dependent helicase HrpB [Gimibacter soli]|uniref:ATP-dependent helicase HrpB n=1 Tax=Gimibacter soli TaxID=3024400 RepID=A0AAE9XMI6_9PROT|nr:ATP-dependent helicase HrpB [Gimibacter soli]WCL53697.1 ATP-dependent helicase HrpB [Gimibacter soli]
MKDTLPIDPLLPEIAASLAAAPSLVLEAPPGAGKTTRVPLALMDTLGKAGKIILLEPRRIAARTAAERMAATLGEPVGGRVGYRVRQDRKIGKETIVEVVTTGLFLRQIQADPSLEGVATVLFDEFHERSLDSDLALAFAIEAQQGLRDDLKLVVMSATLDGERVMGLLPGAKRLTSEGRSFPVALKYLDQPAGQWMETGIVSALRQALKEQPGDALVFLPGQAEIRRTERLIAEAGFAGDCIILPLYGDLKLEDQTRAVRPDAQGRRKIVLATAIAETSLTIDGVTIVIDSGYRRSPAFDPASGMTALKTVRVSAAAAAQRAGRAGRTAPGTCWRLWSEAANRALSPHTPPEIMEADLAGLALELAVWGDPEGTGLALLDPPPAAPLAQARDLLMRLGAVDADGRATVHGRQMAALGTHPRLAHMMARAGHDGLGALAADIAAILSERDFLKGPPDARDADLRLRLELLSGKERIPAGLSLDRGAFERAKQSARDWRRQLGDGVNTIADPSEAGRVLALAYPDRLAMKRGKQGDFRLSNGRGALLPATDALAREDFLAVAHLDGDKQNARIFLAAPINLADIEADFADAVTSAEEVHWDGRTETVVARRVKRLWSLELEEKPLKDASPDAKVAAMVEGIRAMGLNALPWTKELAAWRARVRFAAKHAPDDWPDLSDEALLASLEDWLAPYLTGVSRKAHLAGIDLSSALKGLIDWNAAQALDRLVPTHLTVPTGNRHPLDYDAGDVPVLACRLQEMFGATETPTIMDGRVPVLLHLLSPAHRPLAVTQDLVSFWNGAYAHVKADMKGRYPKHYWPDNPLDAEPTARAKPRR